MRKEIRHNPKYLWHCDMPLCETVVVQESEEPEFPEGWFIAVIDEKDDEMGMACEKHTLYRNKPSKRQKVLYVVIGSEGEYEDYREWMVKAFKDEQKAQTYRDKCQRWIDHVLEIANELDEPAWSLRYKTEDNPYDPGCRVSTNTSYDVEEVEYEDC
jgi:hypothetical protein